MNKRLHAGFILSAVLGLAGVFSTAALAGGDPPSLPSFPHVIDVVKDGVVDPIEDGVTPIVDTVVDAAKQVCRDIPNPVVEACKAEIKCYTGPVGGAFCGGQVPALCGQSGSVAERAEAAVKMAIEAAVCKAIAPDNKAMMVSIVAQMLERCGTAAAGAPPPDAINQFCAAIQSLPDQACGYLGPATINICKSPADW